MELFAVPRYWADGLWKIDAYLFVSYGWGRAYRVSLRNRPKDRLLGLTYGETPLHSFHQMMLWAECSSADVFYELGSGTGRLTLMIAKHMNIPCVGFDCIAPFVVEGNRIAQRLGLSQCHFVEANIFEVSWSPATLIYVTATAFTEEQIALFSHKCAELPVGARCLSLSHKPNNPCMKIMDMKMFDFSWGATAVYISVRIGDELGEIENHNDEGYHGDMHQEP